MLHNLFLLDMSTYKEFVIKNELVEKATPFFFYGRGLTASQPSVGARRENVSPRSFQ